MVKLNNIDFEDIKKEHKQGRELANIIIRKKGDREDYLRAYNMINFGGK